MSNLNSPWCCLRLCPLVIGDLGEEPDPHLARATFQGGAESDKRPLESPFLQAEQALLLQLLN